MEITIEELRKLRESEDHIEGGGAELSLCRMETHCPERKNAERANARKLCNQGEADPQYHKRP